MEKARYDTASKWHTFTTVLGITMVVFLVLINIAGAARVQIDQIRCETTSSGGPEKTAIIVAADTPAVILFEASPTFTSGSVFNIGRVFEYQQQIRIHVIEIKPTGNVVYGPAVIFSQASPFDAEGLTGLFQSTLGLPGRYDMIYRILPAAPGPTPAPPAHRPPSTDQLNRIGQALVEAISETVTLVPIGDEGAITLDTIQFNPAKYTIHFHITIHYKQSSVPGFLGQITGPLYDFTTFYQGDIDLNNPLGSIEQTQYGFDLPNIPGFGTTRVSLNAAQLATLAKLIGAILA